MAQATTESVAVDCKQTTRYMKKENDTQETQQYLPLSPEAERWQRFKSLINAALEMAGEEREKFLQQTCGDDRELRREVEKLLATYPSGNSFLEQPAGRIAGFMDELVPPLRRISLKRDEKCLSRF